MNNSKMKKNTSPGYCFVAFALPHFLFVEDFEVRKKSVLSCSLAWNISLFPDHRAREEQIDRVWSMVKADGIGPPPEGFEQLFKSDIRRLIEQKMDLFPEILCKIPSPVLVNQGRYDVLTVTMNDEEEKHELPIFPDKEGMPLILQALMTMQGDTAAQVDNIRKLMSLSHSGVEDDVMPLIASYSVQRAEMGGYHRMFSQWRDTISDPLGSQGIALGFQLINDINANAKTILSLLRERLEPPYFIEDEENKLIMGDIHTYLPRLTVNELFIRDLMAAESPCFALGYVEERGSHCGFIALRPEMPIPSASSAQGFRFGHSVLECDGNPVLHFAFEFYGHALYHGLVVPSNPIIHAVIDRMLETKDYFFFAINPDQTVIAFRSQLESANLAGLKTNQKKFGTRNCTPEHYEKAVKIFTKKPDPHGLVMKWACRNNWDYLDLTKNRLELHPKS